MCLGFLLHEIEHLLGQSLSYAGGGRETETEMKEPSKCQTWKYIGQSEKHSGGIDLATLQSSFQYVNLAQSWLKLTSYLRKKMNKYFRERMNSMFPLSQ